MLASERLRHLVLPARLDARLVRQLERARSTSSAAATTQGKGRGESNLGGYCNPKVDELTDADPGRDRRQAKRDELIAEAFRHRATTEVGYIPLHQQSLAWGVSKKVKMVQRADNQILFYWVTKDE